MIIAMMSDTFNRVTRLQEQFMLKEMCSMISDNEYVLKRENIFRNSKYIIIARLEKAGFGDSETVEGRIDSLKMRF